MLWRHFGQLVLCLGLLGARPAQAQDAALSPDTTQAAGVTQQRLDDFQESVSKQTDLDEAVQGQISELIQQATTDLKTAEAARAQASKAEQLIAGLEAEQARLEKQLAEPVEPVTISSERSIPELESEQVEIQTQITQWEQDLKKPTIDPAARTASRTSLRDQLTELPARLNAVDEQLKEPVPETELPLVSEARKLALGAQKQAIEARLESARKEMAQYDAADAINLPTLRREELIRKLNSSRKRLEAIKVEVNARRQAEAERRAREARMAEASARPGLKAIFKENQEIARTEQEVRVDHESDKQLLQEVSDRLKVIQDDAKDAQVLDENVGLEKRGLWLRKQREVLNDLPELLERVRKRTDQATDVLFAFYEREDQLDDLADLEAAADQLTDKAADQGNVDREAFHADALQVLRSQTVNLQKLIDEYSAYTDTLVTLSNQTGALQKEADEFADFLDERILWVRSHQPLSVRMAFGEIRDHDSLLSPRSWVAALQSLGWDADDHRLLYGSVSLLLAYLLLTRARHTRQLQEVAKRAGGRVNVSMAPTNHCLALTVMLAIIWPGLLLFLAWRLHASTISSPELQIAAQNLMRLASLFFLLEFVRQSIRPQGLADAHFEWSGKTLRRVRRLLWTLMIVGLPLAAAAACLHLQEPGSRRDDFERLLFIASLVVLMGFAHRMFHPRTGALSQLSALQDGGWFDRLGYVWYLLGLTIPLTLCVLAYLGYYDTAVRLALRVQRTAWLVVAAVYLHAMISRWLLLRHRRLRIEEARQRLAAAQESSPPTAEAEILMPDADADRADIDAISQQSRRMLSTMLAVGCLIGLWLIWVDVLPAIRFLDRWPLWETTVQSSETVPDPNTGGTQIRQKIDVHPVTIASLVQVVLILLLTTTAARNVPGLLEMSVLARLPIDRSTAYAITTLTRYGLVLIGLILASQPLGLTWSNVQWLAAALTFGLGFGLQEIFANFVSGLIILFEQPVRVGDVVTIDGVSGVVNRIRIRATTILDWDRKEYIVPNREFITGRLLNWTLSDKMTRVTINVGVAYGSNAPQVRELILKVLEDHTNILTDPPPMVTFEAFGDSSLDFVARAYLPNLDSRLATIHELHSEIYDRLAKAGIEIPFPQRDLHLRTSVTIDELGQATASTNGQSSSETPSESVS